MIQVLSIDWDFFFEDASGYDWGANEESPFMYEAIWNIRCNSRNIFTKQHVLDNFHPDIPANFWSIAKGTHSYFIICESHFSLLSILQQLKDVTVVNIDAHHDMSYWAKQESCCGSWGWYGKKQGYIKEFHQIYPQWRKNCEENHVQSRRPDRISYELPKPNQYDIVFLCRSGCWTPPWHDQDFYDLIHSAPFKSNYHDQLVQRHREPKDLDTAWVIAKQFDTIEMEIRT